MQYSHLGSDYDLETGRRWRVLVLEKARLESDHDGSMSLHLSLDFMQDFGENDAALVIGVQTLWQTTFNLLHRHY